VRWGDDEHVVVPGENDRGELSVAAHFSSATTVPSEKESPP
jgi:hypothetical protein